MLRHGALQSTTNWVNAVLSDTAHPMFHTVIASAARSGLVQKVNPATGEFKGWRTLGIREKPACLVWGTVVNLKKKGSINHLLTPPLPEDVAEHQRGIEHAESTVTAAELNLTATELNLTAAISSTAPAAISAAPPVP